MKPWKTLDRAPAPGGGELVLQERDGQFVIRVDGKELMSSRTHGSEEAMAEAAFEGRRGLGTARVLVGGLGMGFTLRAALERLPPTARVVVAELSLEVIRWNRERLGSLAGAPLEDARTSVEEADVLTLVRRAPRSFDAILLDVDNGPVALTRPGNSNLYGDRGVASFREALKPGGVLVVWSAGPDEKYLARLGRAGFHAEVRQLTRQGKRHTLFVAKR